MHIALLGAHNIVRWFVLLAGAWAALRAWRGWLGRGAWTASDLAAGRLFVNLLTLQFVLGACLYAVSPLIRAGMADVGRAMRTADTRYFMVEHVLMMVVALALAHVGRARVARAVGDAAKFQAAGIWWGIAAGVVAGFIPWARPMLPF